MTRTQWLALLTSSGVAFLGGAVVYFSVTPTPTSATWVHHLRIESDLLPDGGKTADRIIAYRTKATPEPDGGVDLEDIGPSRCTGNTGPVRTWALGACKLLDGGTVTRLRIIEASPAAGAVSLSLYGDEVAQCPRVPKPTALSTFLASLVCAPAARARGGGGAL